MLQEIERNGEKTDRYSMLFVQNPSDAASTGQWTLNILYSADILLLRDRRSGEMVSQEGFLYDACLRTLR